MQTVANLGFDSMPAVPLAAVDAIHSCAATVYGDGTALTSFFSAMNANSLGIQPQEIAVWPVLNLDLSGLGHTYVYDYVLSVASGNNTWLNNAGSNVIDPFNGPLTNHQPARGCELVSEILGAAVPKCVLASGLAIQLGGTSTFGQFQSPDADATITINGTTYTCTTGNLVRRIFTEGSAVAGVGILINTGNATYDGKVGAQGAGHIGGVGILEQDGGTNTFDAIRNSQGFGFIGGTGILLSNGASNTFTNYMPAATTNTLVDPDTPGYGIIDDAGHCEGRPRHLQGSGELGGVGALLSKDSPSSYSSDTVLSQGTGDIFPPGTPQPNLGGAGFGFLVIEGGWGDTFSGVPNRAQDMLTIGPRSDLSAVDYFAGCEHPISSRFGPGACLPI